MKELEVLANRIRKDIVELTHSAKRDGAHIGGALSAADILAVLYGKILKLDSNDPQWPLRDRFILSKGHTALGLYAALHQIGYLPDEDMCTFEADRSDFPVHCVKNPTKGIELSSGSLGVGLSFGIGSALAAKKRGLDYRVYVLIGNGECNEGCIWEAAMAAPHFGLDNLVAIIDNNGFQNDGDSKLIMHIPNFSERFQSFGWNAVDVDGHDTSALYGAFEAARKTASPTAIIAKTIKGKGVSFMENHGEWHHSALNDEQYAQAVAELGEGYD